MQPLEREQGTANSRSVHSATWMVARRKARIQGEHGGGGGRCSDMSAKGKQVNIHSQGVHLATWVIARQRVRRARIKGEHGGGGGRCSEMSAKASG